MTTIPASAIVSVNPGVISAGGTALDINGLFLHGSDRIPAGKVISFPSAAAVGAYFGVGSWEATLAAVYFAGFDNSNVKPAAMLFSYYTPTSAVSSTFIYGANMWGGQAPATLAAFQAITSGTLTISLNGTAITATGINLSTATSLSNVASLLTTAFNAVANATAESVFTGSISGPLLTVSAVTSGVISVGQVLTGSSVTAGTKITAFASGTNGGVGTYSVSPTNTTSSTTITGNSGGVLITYNSAINAFHVQTREIVLAGSTISFATGTIAAPLAMTAATGAFISQGFTQGQPSAIMNAIVAQNANWVTFALTADPDGGSGNATKLLFANWAATQNNRYAYVASDSDITPTQSTAASSCMGDILAASNSSGTCLVYDPLFNSNAFPTGPSTIGFDAAFVMGTAASIDFTETNGRITFAFKSQSGLSPTVTDATTAANLLANGYNFYGAYATANDQFIWLYNGQISGPFDWADSFINQVWLNNQFQLALMVLLQNTKAIPYDALGYGLIRAAMGDPIQQGLNFGAFAPGTISLAEQAEVNAAAGLNIAAALQAQGYYLQVLDASSQVRAARGSPPITFWYLDRGSVQSISVASVEVQ